MLSWFGCSLGYYGLSFNAENMGLEVHLSSLLFSGVEIPPLFLAMKMVGMSQFGRKGTVGLFIGISGIGCILSAFAGSGGFSIFLGLAGKCFVSGAFGILYVYGS